MDNEDDIVTIEEDGPLLLIGVNRPQANNLWNLEVIQAVSRAYRRLGDAEHLRAGVVHAHGKHFPHAYGGLQMMVAFVRHTALGCYTCKVMGAKTFKPKDADLRSWLGKAVHFARTLPPK